MDNSQSVWRIRAKIVAYINLVLLCIEILVVIGFALIATGITVIGATAMDNKDSSSSPTPSKNFGFDETKNDNDDDAKSVLTVVTVIAWVIVGFIALATGIQIWATVKLLNASEIGKSAYEAVANARTWRNVSIVFFVFAVLGCFTLNWYTFLAVSWRGSFIYVVYEYIKELEGLIFGTNNVSRGNLNVVIAK